ncbi:MAG: ZIP family metal transporter [Candidatus Auribacterota bacterium]|nr:ZIP family metal transporter [Candidatus Auribacterota bacterium]
MNLILTGSLASLLAGLATGIGALLVFFVRKVSDRFLDASLGFAAGVMLAATSFSLIVPAIEVGGIWKTVIGIILGAVFLIYAEKFTPHMHHVTGVKGPSAKLSKLWLFILAITIHNFPEGMAVGVGFGGGDIKAGTALAIGIGLQNIPEGLAVALPLLREKSTRAKAFLIALLTGLVEPIGGFLGISIVSVGEFLLPYGLAFAAGAMLFVISEEIIPETHSRGNDREATIGVIIGFIIMMVLDNIFG